MTNLDSIFKSRDITLPTKVRLFKAMVFPVVMYGCESWTVKKAECRRIDAFVQDIMFLSRGNRDLGVAFQAPPGSQASSRGEAKDSARDEDLREPLVRRQGSQVSMRVARGSASWLSRHGRGLGPRDVLKKDSRGLCRGAAGNLVSLAFCRGP